MKLEEVLESCQEVMKKAKYVTIQEENLKQLVKNMKIEKQTHWMSNIKEINSFSIQEMVHFLLIYHAIGFSYWGEPKWTIEYKEKQYDGAIGLIMAFCKELEQNPSFLQFHQLEKTTLKDWERILQGNTKIPMLEERYECIQEISHTVTTQMNNNFYEQIKDLDKDEELFQSIIQNFPSFTDKAEYDDKPVYFYKRAQLLTSDILYWKKQKEGKEIINQNLVGCADYKIPQVLRNLNIVMYTKELADLIDKQVEIPKQSKYEIEIRASMIVVIQKIKEIVGNCYSNIEINDYLWLKGQEKGNKKFPYHRTRTIAY